MLAGNLSATQKLSPLSLRDAKESITLRKEVINSMIESNKIFSEAMKNVGEYMKVFRIVKVVFTVLIEILI